ncbi:MAG: N-acetylmuramoyl-L-alanine amidase [Bilifractor sp.]
MKSNRSFCSAVRLIVSFLLIASFLIFPGKSTEKVFAQSKESVPVYRMYNPNSGEHFYTKSETEKKHLRSLGWKYEGVGWVSPVTSSVQVFRLYNPVAGDHHYTLSSAERDHLVSVGWRYEGIGWYSDENETVPVYRQYNPNAVSGTHNFTTKKAENDHLAQIGWRAEGISWYSLSFNPADYEQPPKAVIEIDPGHQERANLGREPIGPGSSQTKYKVTGGARGDYTKNMEYQINLDISRKLRAVLESRGYEVHLTRESNQVNISNIERAQKAARDHADIFIRIHCNSVSSHTANGVLCCGPADNNPYLSGKIIRESQRLTRILQKYQCAATGQKKCSNIYTNDMSGINWASMPVTIVETGFLSNRNEDYFLSDASCQQKIADGIANGVDAYFSGEQ